MSSADNHPDIPEVDADLIESQHVIAAEPVTDVVEAVPPPGARAPHAAQGAPIPNTRAPSAPTFDGPVLEGAAEARTSTTLTARFRSLAEPITDARLRLPKPETLVREGVTWTPVRGDAPLTALLRARAVEAQRQQDPVTTVRALLELAHSLLESGDPQGAEREVEQALTLAPSSAAGRALGRLLSLGRDRRDDRLKHVEAWLKIAQGSVRSDLLAEQGVLLEVGTKPSKASAQCYAQALVNAPHHWRALYGREGAEQATSNWSAVAALLTEHAELAVLDGQPDVAAWYLVERAFVLDVRRGQRAEARAAFDQAIALSADEAVITAALDHALFHRDLARAAELLERLATTPSETSPESAARAAARLFDAALAHRAVAERPDAVTQLLRAALARCPEDSVLRVRIAEDLAEQESKAGAHAEAKRLRALVVQMYGATSAVNASASGPSGALLFALRDFATSAEAAGDFDAALGAWEQARALEGDGSGTLDDVQRVLRKLGSPETTMAAWLTEAAMAQKPSHKVRAFLAAAQAATEAGRKTDALKCVHSAWVASPGDAASLEAFVERLPPLSARTHVGERVAIYAEAAQRSVDPARKVMYLEKIAWLWDDVAGDAAQARATYQDILAMAPKHRAAWLGLASSAMRSGEARVAAKALIGLSELTEEVSARTELVLRAATLLVDVDPERARALLVPLTKTKGFELAALEVEGQLLSVGERWEELARNLAERRRLAATPPQKTALALHEAALLAERLDKLDEAARVLEEARAAAPRDAFLTEARLRVLKRAYERERVADTTTGVAKCPARDAYRAELEKYGDASDDKSERARRLARAAELYEEEAGRDNDAARLYLRARTLLADDVWLTDRLARLGARVPVPHDVTTPLLRGIRALRTGAPLTEFEKLRAHGNAFAYLRLAELGARAQGGASELAAVLTEQVGMLGSHGAGRALAGLLHLTEWHLTETLGEVEPWASMLLRGCEDTMLLDTLLLRSTRALSAQGEPTPFLMDVAQRAAEARLAHAGDDSERCVLLLWRARIMRRAGKRPEAMALCRAALAIEPSSVAASVLLGSLASELSDRDGVIEAASGLARVVQHGRARADLLRDAGDLALAEHDHGRAARLYEEALEAEPNATDAAARLASLQLGRGAFPELAESFKRVLQRATAADAIVPIACELAEIARTRLADPRLAIGSLERAANADPTSVPVRFSLAELYIEARAWSQALDTLASVTHAKDRDARVIAWVGRAAIKERALGDVVGARTELMTALELDPSSARALRALASIAESDAQRVEWLRRLARLPQVSHVERKRVLLDLAQRERALGNAPEADGALIEAVAMDPGPEMLARFKEAVPGPPGRVRMLIAAMLTKAEAQGTTPTPAWLLELGHAELGDGKLHEATQTYEAARAHGPYAFDATFALGRAHLELGNYAEAAGALRQMMTLDGGLGLPYVRLLHEALQRSGASQEAFVAKELLALAHDGGDAITMALAQRRFAMTATGDVLGSRGLRNMVMPLLGHHPIWDVGAAATELAGKFARVPLTELGATTRDRVKPRAVHPLRPIFEHFQRVFDLPEIELAVAAGCRDAGIALENEIWIVVPSALAEWPEPMVNATFARLFARVALGVPWWGPFEPRAVLANLVAFARQVAPRFTALPSERLEPFVLDAEDRARRSIDRKRRKALEEHMTLQHAPALTEADFQIAVARTEARCAFLLSGDVRAVLHVLASSDPFVLEALRTDGPVGLAKVLSQPLLRDLVAFAMSPEASRVRRNLGTTFAV